MDWSGLNRTKVGKMDWIWPREPNGPNRIEVDEIDKIGPNRTKVGKIDWIGPMWTKVDKLGLIWTE